MQPSASIGAAYVFRGNSGFDPDFTSTGGQPAQWDDYSAVYNRYRIYGSKISWSVANSASGALDLTSLVIGPRHTSTSIVSRSNQENFQAQPYTRYQKTIIYNNGTASQSGTMSMTTRKFIGMTQNEFLGAEEWAAPVSTNPANCWYWQLSLSSDDQTSTTTHYVNFVIEYDIEFFERVDTSLDLQHERLLGLRRTKAQNDLDKAKRPVNDDSVPGFTLVDIEPPRAAAARLLRETKERKR
jgi:hypothetical protein